MENILKKINRIFIDEDKKKKEIINEKPTQDKEISFEEVIRCYDKICS